VAGYGFASNRPGPDLIRIVAEEKGIDPALDHALPVWTSAFGVKWWTWARKPMI
jgi:hypothetical protein